MSAPSQPDAGRQGAVPVPPCDLCGKVQTELGGLLFSPPDSFNNVRKSHVCVDCYGSVFNHARCVCSIDWDHRCPVHGDHEEEPAARGSEDA